MNIDYFLENAAYVIDYFPEEGDYRTVMETDTHDMYFYFKDGEITNIEAYNALDDSTVFLSQDELKKIKIWMNHNVKDVNGENFQ